MPSFMIYISPLKSIVPNNTTYSLPQESENVHFFLPLVLPTPPHLHLLYRLLLYFVIKFLHLNYFRLSGLHIFISRPGPPKCHIGY